VAAPPARHLAHMKRAQQRLGWPLMFTGTIAVGARTAYGLAPVPQHQHQITEGLATNLGGRGIHQRERGAASWTLTRARIPSLLTCSTPRFSPSSRALLLSASDAPIPPPRRLAGGTFSYKVLTAAELYLCARTAGPDTGGAHRVCANSPQGGLQRVHRV